MCDYSLESVKSRAARVADRLVSTSFVTSFTRGFAAVDDLDTAVCVMPGAEIAFDEPVAYEKPVTYEIVRSASKVARFCKIDEDKERVHHDALEFPDGQVVLLSRLVPGQTATVLQLPAKPDAEQSAQGEEALTGVEESGSGEETIVTAAEPGLVHA